MNNPLVNRMEATGHDRQPTYLTGHVIIRAEFEIPVDELYECTTEEQAEAAAVQRWKDAIRAAVLSVGGVTETGRIIDSCTGLEYEVIESDFSPCA